jgi:ABC-type arginine/histidine transport system permease subunit
MRLSHFRRRRAVALWIGMALLLCAFAPEAVAGALQTTTPGLCGGAVALGLALIRAVNGD